MNDILIVGKMDDTKITRCRNGCTDTIPIGPVELLFLLPPPPPFELNKQLLL